MFDTNLINGLNCANLWVLFTNVFTDFLHICGIKMSI